MSTPTRPFPAQLIISILSSRWEQSGPDLKQELEQKFGRIDYQSDYMPFLESNYYDRELGTPIYRVFFGFQILREADELMQIKLFTNSLEQKYSDAHGQRWFNLDPGLLFLERLILATGKNNTHRIYLGRGIWADLTLLFQNGQWRSLPWTYPDYAGDAIQGVLLNIRDNYKQKLKKIKNFGR